MKEIKKCSLSGIAFSLDTDAYTLLDDYLRTLRETYGTTPDGQEIVADIEARIAELILSHQENTRIVERALVEEIIGQLGSAEAISEESDETPHTASPRIPRRLYRDTEHAKLGGVCAGMANYFDIDPVWVRLALFAPLLGLPLSNIPLLGWLDEAGGNLFGVFLLGYLIMWFAVPPARSARQRLEMKGERITLRSLRDETDQGEANPAARTAIGSVLEILGKLLLIVLKIIAVLFCLGLIATACGLLIGACVLLFGRSADIPGLSPVVVNLSLLWIVVVLIPVLYIIYMLGCLLFSRRLSGRGTLVTALAWILLFIGATGYSIHQATNMDAFRNMPVIHHFLPDPAPERPAQRRPNGGKERRWQQADTTAVVPAGDDSPGAKPQQLVLSVGAHGDDRSAEINMKVALEERDAKPARKTPPETAPEADAAANPEASAASGREQE